MTRRQKVFRGLLIVGIVIALALFLLGSVVLTIAVMDSRSDARIAAFLGGQPTAQPNTSQVNEGEEFAVNAEEQRELYVGHGEFIEVDWDAYHNTQGYFIPREQLSLMASYGYLMFEGEQRTEGIHDILSVVFPDGTFSPQVGIGGFQLRDEGSFWRYEPRDEALPGYSLVDDLLMAFATDKRRNWNDQGMEGNPITVWLSSGEVTFLPDEPIELTAGQQALVNSNAEARCPTGNEPLEENPLGDPQSNDLVIAQIGSSSCITLLVRGDIVNWFDGPRDGIRYKPSETRVFLIPIDWDEDDMIAFLERAGIAYSAISEMQ